MATIKIRYEFSDAYTVSDNLLKVELNIIPGSVCNDSYSSFLSASLKLKYGILNDRMICASPLEGTTDVCGVWYLFFNITYLHDNVFKLIYGIL